MRCAPVDVLGSAGSQCSARASGGVLFGIALVVFVTSHIAASWKLVIPAANEVLTISAMVHWAKNRTGYWQVAFLSVAWLADVLCYAHLKSGGQLHFFYDHYETIIQVVAVGQLAACYDTIQFHFGRAYLWASRLWSVPVASGGSAVLHSESHPDV